MKKLPVFFTLFLTTLISALKGQTLDLSYGSQGITTTIISNVDMYVRTSAVYPDGRVLVAGQIDEPSSSPSGFIARYRANGTLDPTFGNGGFVTFGASGSIVLSLVILPNKKIMALTPYTSSASVYRFDSTGNTDASFGTIADVGYVRVSYTDMFAPEQIGYLNVMKIQSDGKILLGGWSEKGSYRGFFIGRLSANGLQRDNGFLYSQDVYTSGGGSEVKDLLIRPNGEVVAIGYCRVTPGSEKVFVVLKFANGSGFGYSYYEGTAEKIIEEDSGNFLVAGSVDNASTTPGETQTYIRVMRIMANGSMDLSFGTSGITTFSTSNLGSSYDIPMGIVSLQESKYIIIGTAIAATGFSTSTGPFMAKLNYNGSRDLTFGSQGIQSNLLGTGDTYALSHCKLVDERIVVVGFKKVNSLGGIAISRWYPKCTKSKTLNPIVCGNDTWYFQNEEFTTAGTYYRKFIGTSCDTSYTINLQILPIVSPTVSITSNSSSTICAGKAVTFSVSAYQYGGTNPAWIWRKNGTTVSTTSTYSSSTLANGDLINLEMQSSRQCLSSFPPSPLAYSNDITMTVNPNPVVNTSVSGNMLNCSPVSGAQYQWLNCTTGNSPISGATNASFSPTQNGSYAIKVTRNSCSTTSNCIPFVFTSTNETIDMRPFTLSPNPAVDFISIDGMNTKAGYMVFDGIGRCVVSGVAGINSSLIDIHTLTKGWYFLKIEGLEVKRFLKE